MRFTEQFQVERPDNADWFDLNVEKDTPLYVDPFLIFDDEEGHWEGAHDEIVDFFAAALDLLKQAGGEPASAHWIKAEQFLQFPEPKEFALGFAMGDPEGAGVGPDLARDVCRALDLFRQWERNADDRLLGMVSILVPGLGVDRISDMVCNILKKRFIEYTQEICGDLGVETTQMRVTHTNWTASTCRWKSSNEMLPSSPVFNGAILLTPERFLKDIPRFTSEGLWSWAEIHENSKLRFELNYDLGQSLTRKQKVARGLELARRAPDIVESYVDDVVAADPSPYDVSADPKGLVRWEEAGRRIANASTAPPPPATQGEFEEWLTALATSFKTAVEDNGLWVALWNDEKTHHRKEKIAQVIARECWVFQCKAYNIDITREADCGRGPVDFKFTQGWTMRGLIEIKHIASTHFVHGANTQLPIYLVGESAPFGIYVCMGYRDRDFEDDRIALVESACNSISAKGTTQILPLIVDARPKKSASKA
ncbi:hypothetical protein MINTM020_25290 [Mycobacterium paraintracellulare]|uniref:hypothetical protein n=1 Tax=Mycobacterium paraintracellulare TaxID=1138383 RepID=UPI0019270C61|nr:hypothetical protein [Mycobacterium paraintracellulare]BCP10431.1 hypothetical protein MINTM020_25290 [Mycobacterium paraintracellulare]